MMAVILVSLRAILIAVTLSDIMFHYACFGPTSALHSLMINVTSHIKEQVDNTISFQPQIYIKCSLVSVFQEAVSEVGQIGTVKMT